jgi:Fe-S cluster biogenesis protein NfuA
VQYIPESAFLATFRILIFDLRSWIDLLPEPGFELMLQRRSNRKSAIKNPWRQVAALQGAVSIPASRAASRMQTAYNQNRIHRWLKSFTWTRSNRPIGRERLEKEMPKISDIEETPNPNAVKFMLREPISNGVAQSFPNAGQAANDPLAKALFDVGQVVSVFYMDSMITVEKSDDGDWDELLPTLAVPIRAAPSITITNAAAAVGGAIAAVTSDDPRLLRINEILDEKVRPALMGDGGYLEVLGLKDQTLTIRYQGACGSCPSSLTGTLMAIEGMLKQEIDPDLEVIAV